MKKLLLLLAIPLGLFTLSGCSDEQATDDHHIDTLSISFVPSREPEEIITATEPLESMLIEELGNQGYTVDNVDISVGTSYEVTGESLASGSVDVAFIPGGTYVMYEEDGVELLLTATRSGLSKDSPNAIDWNDGEATLPTDEQVTYYRSLMVAGPSEVGQSLAETVNSGGDLTADELMDAQWCMESPTSSSGYIYPSLWLNENFGITIADLPNQVQVNGYPDAISRLANGQCDIAPMYADARRDSEEDWTSTYSRDKSIWEETNVIGVSDGIMNDTISVSENSDIMTDEFKEALKTSFINIGNTDEGKDVIAIYSHEGYVEATPEDYDAEREAQKMVSGN